MAHPLFSISDIVTIATIIVGVAGIIFANKAQIGLLHNEVKALRELIALIRTTADGAHVRIDNLASLLMRRGDQSNHDRRESDL